MFMKLIREERAAAAVEYGLIAGLISMACIVALTRVGINLTAVLDKISNALPG